MTQLPDPDARLLRRPLAEALSAAGFPIAAATLATLACRGGGPLYMTFNGRAVYRFGDALEWAQSRMSASHATAAERRAGQAA
jgi:hypothetical protein